ncbi:hypothetical protein AUJ66_01285 [Candidatus Desantisbacteria bacterium CG1_02_38_46]|uniref:Glycosyltransferase n=1 Tax=Candidatus Desantisbacteria bacterium CG1_02_38_46 TaxID=1817893 RepID=A0A1J4SJR3_9BACT|nr:MAG: hypothetical protein AUJ66_01285 [Candidatus Desantisbacteria bacterium CG1_02_38_46]
MRFTFTAKKFPSIKLDYLKTLTDDMGLLQHGKYSIPDRKSGYTTDDNARALIVVLNHHNLLNDDESADLVGAYLEFLHYAQREDGKFHNLVDYRRDFLDEEGSEDSQGRALWGCGCTLDAKIYHNVQKLAKELFEKSVTWSLDFKSFRARAYTIFGLYHYYRKYPQQDILEKMKFLLKPLEEVYQRESSKTQEWKWFEPYLTYDNARLSQAFFCLYEVTKEKKYLQIGLESLEFLSKLSFVDNKLVLIGQEKWYQKDGKKSLYDQQPIDAAAMVELNFQAYRITKDKKYKEKAFVSFEWFLGRNIQNAVIYDEQAGACFDGLTPEGVNLNQGAESTVSYLLARLNIEEMIRNRKY